mgnify:CR=1 FL=1
MSIIPNKPFKAAKAISECLPRARRDCCIVELEVVINNSSNPIIGTINWLLDSNYLYLCDKPIVNNPLIVGDWPWYIVFLEIIALIHFWLLYQPIKLFKNK